MKTFTSLLVLCLLNAGVAAGQCQTTPLSTTFASNNGQAGNMFDIVAIQDVTICSFDIHCDANNPTEMVEIYTKTGTHVGFETTAAAWTLIGSATVACAGINQPTPVPLTLNTPIASGSTQAFYVTLTTSNLNYTNGSTVGNVYAQDANIQIREGAGKSYPFGNTFMPRVWNGTVNYCTGLLVSCEFVQILVGPPTAIPATFPGFANTIPGTLAAAVDVDDDGGHDLVTGNNSQCNLFGCPLWAPQDPGGLTLHLNNGDDTFAAPVLIAPTAWSSRGVRGLDLEGDGDTDLVSLGFQGGFGGSGNQLCILENDGTGSFNPPVIVQAPSWSLALLTGDFNGDGATDALLYGGAGSVWQVQKFINDGTGAFTTGPVVPLLGLPAAAITGDLDADGCDDFVYADLTGIGSLLGTPQGVFQPENFAALPAVLAAPRTLALGDWNADGDLDLATGHSGLGLSELRITYGNGQGGLTPGLILPVPPTTITILSMATVDFDQDGDDDLLYTWEEVADTRLQLLVNDGAGAFDTPLAPMVVGAGAEALPFPGDNEGLPELLTANRTGGSFTHIANLTPHLRLMGEPTPGQMLSLWYVSPTTPGKGYGAALSTSQTPGIPLMDGRTFPLTPDFLLSMTIQPNNGLLMDNTGTLDASGSATGAAYIPAMPSISGLSFFGAFAVFDPAASMGVALISLPREVKIP